ncbi:MAG: phosphoenolpyruvate carboxykinase (GTP) [Candidatus Micrarchaeota archaeon]
MPSLHSSALEKINGLFSAESLRKLEKIGSEAVCEFAAEYAALLEPASVFVSDGSPDDVEYVRRKAIENAEERALARSGHTAHYDNYCDQGRDKEHTLILAPRGVDLGAAIATKEREEGLKEIREIMTGIARGREAFLCFYCLGPTRSAFSIPCVQLTDSAYVAHNENLLYRQGYDELVRNPSTRFFKFVHSAGELDERRVSKNIGERRVYIDLEGETVFSANTQYGGNSIGLKKLAMRLAIRRAATAGWLTEHMLVMAVHPPKNVRASDKQLKTKTYFTGAFPSMCGKTSTALLEGETIIGDDIAYLRAVNGKCMAVNVERGVFGIIEGINEVDDALQWRALATGKEVIFSNVLVTPQGEAYWTGKFGKENENEKEKEKEKISARGENHSGAWFPGKRDEKTGKAIPASHKNSRFTFSLDELPNLDEAIDEPAGVQVGAFVYGGRDSDTCVPVEEAFDWEHGIITKGASLESESTAATLGKEGVREINPMSNIDFLSVPIGEYVKMNLEFGGKLAPEFQPKIFSVNYFLRDASDGSFLTSKINDGERIPNKAVTAAWFKWMKLRCDGEAKAIKTPTGLIPHYEDLKRIFHDVLGKEYGATQYERQFAVRVPQQLAKIKRVRAFYEKLQGAPNALFSELDKQEKRLTEPRARFGDLIPPSKLA